MSETARFVKCQGAENAGIDDASLIERSFLEAEQFAVIFDRHAAHIHRYLARRVGSQMAEDLVGETFLAAFANRDAYDMTFRNARPWLYGIATNVVSRHRRSEFRFHRLERQASRPLGGDIAERVAAEVTAEAVRALLVEALRSLRPFDRDVLLLVTWEELAYEEVARSLHIPIGTVRSRLHRARAEIRRFVSEHEHYEPLSEVLDHE